MSVNHETAELLRLVKRHGGSYRKTSGLHYPVFDARGNYVVTLAGTSGSRTSLSKMRAELRSAGLLPSTGRKKMPAGMPAHWDVEGWRADVRAEIERRGMSLAELGRATGTVNPFGPMKGNRPGKETVQRWNKYLGLNGNKYLGLNGKAAKQQAMEAEVQEAAAAIAVEVPAPPPPEPAPDPEMPPLMTAKLAKERDDLLARYEALQAKYEALRASAKRTHDANVAIGDVLIKVAAASGKPGRAPKGLVDEVWAAIDRFTDT